MRTKRQKGISRNGFGQKTTKIEAKMIKIERKMLLNQKKRPFSEKIEA